MIALLTCVVLSWQTGKWRWMLALRPMLGAAVLAAIVAPWVIAVGSRVGWGVYLQTVYEETIGRSTGTKEGHWGPPGYHLVLLCVHFWPGVLMTGLALRRAWKRRRGGSNLFLLAWAIPVWIVFELVTTKLPHYTMPLYPAIALLSGRAVLAAASGRLVGVREWGTRIGFVIWGLVGAGILVAGIALLVLLSSFDNVDEEATITSLWYLVIGFVLVQTFRSMWNAQWLQAQLRSLIAAVLMLVLLFQTLAPAANRMSTRIVEAIEMVDGEGTRPLAAVDYQEDSLVFLTRGRAERVSREHREAWIARNRGGLLIEDLSGSFSANEIAQGLPGMIVGLNYSRGRIERVWLVIGEEE
jgi:4-amino-4-deoxy-L-arabinose transferase-like glycosyltransferase